MRSDQPELMQLNNSGSDLFEILIREFYRRHIKKGDIVADCGANAGHHTLPLARAVGASGMVHAFEPVPSLADNIEELARKEDLAIRVHRAALSDRPGSATFNFAENMSGLSGLYTRPLNPDAIVSQIVVPVSTLDDELALIDQLSFVKIDVECAEYALIVGASRIMARLSPVLVFENGFETTAQIAGFSKEQWFDVFQSRGYVPYDLYGYEVTPDRWPDFCQPYNTFAVPRGSSSEEFLRGQWSSRVVDDVIAQVRSGNLTWP